jgi:hypothetical protein
MVNVKDLRCIENGCTSLAAYRFPSQNKSHCAKHKQIGQIMYAGKKCDECGDVAEYGYRSDNILRKCEAHMEDTMYKLAIQLCIQCQQLEPLNKQSLCIMCVEGRTTRILKQARVKEFFDAKGIKYVTCDAIIDNGECNRLRPDFIIDCVTHYVVVEVDEFQHKKSSYGCEQSRMINIYSALGMETVFIRYNPDKYECGDKKNETEGRRLQTLLRIVNHMMQYKNLMRLHLSVIYLFYDGNDQTLQKVEHTYFN